MNEALARVAARLRACHSHVPDPAQTAPRPRRQPASGAQDDRRFDPESRSAVLSGHGSRACAREAAKYGYTLIVVDANRDNAKQQSQVEDFISKEVDAIVLTPYDSQAIGSAIVEANNAEHSGLYRRHREHEQPGTVVAHIASDNVQGGFQAGKLICAAVGKSGSVAIIDEPEVTSVQDRVKGFKEALAQLCPGVTIVADVDSGGTRDKANSDTGDILQAHQRSQGHLRHQRRLGARRADGG